MASFVMRGLNPPTPNPPGSFSFGIMGDAPYFLTEEIRFRLVLQDLDAHDLTTVISVGDIFWRPCTDAMYQRRAISSTDCVIPSSGSPNVGWVRVTITPNAREPFAFEPQVIPRWKVW